MSTGLKGRKSVNHVVNHKTKFYNSYPDFSPLFFSVCKFSLFDFFLFSLQKVVKNAKNTPKRSCFGVFGAEGGI